MPQVVALAFLCIIDALVAIPHQHALKGRSDQTVLKRQDLLCTQLANPQTQCNNDVVMVAKLIHQQQT